MLLWGWVAVDCGTVIWILVLTNVYFCGLGATGALFGYMWLNRANKPYPWWGGKEGSWGFWGPALATLTWPLCWLYALVVGYVESRPVVEPDR